MKTDFYTKTILTVIAILLAVIALRNIDLIPKAYANTPPVASKNANYGIVPLNEDGSVNVRISQAEVLKVSLEKIYGFNVKHKGGKLIVEVDNK
ncbi:MAG TPA: hypothetical protein PLT92_10950 [Ignavibacteriaceae bacterium]|jgi:hypothetical protein|nr:hypothetical protein [Ignavibacteriaceae bacterium]HPO54498.1 hypothetical protein [Ignavibacteriaceae bacterium]